MNGLCVGRMRFGWAAQPSEGTLPTRLCCRSVANPAFMLFLCACVLCFVCVHLMVRAGCGWWICKQPNRYLQFAPGVMQPFCASARLLWCTLRKIDRPPCPTGSCSVLRGTRVARGGIVQRALLVLSLRRVGAVCGLCLSHRRYAYDKVVNVVALPSSLNRCSVPLYAGERSLCPSACWCARYRRWTNVRRFRTTRSCMAEHFVFLCRWILLVAERCWRGLGLDLRLSVPHFVPMPAFVTASSRIVRDGCASSEQSAVGIGTVVLALAQVQ